MAVTAPIEGEMQQDTIVVDDVAVDEIVVVRDDVKTEEVHTPDVGGTNYTDPVMLLVYFGLLTLLAIIATSAFLAL